MKQRLVAVVLTLIVAVGFGTYLNQYVFLASKDQKKARDEARAKAILWENKQRELEDKKFKLSSPRGAREYILEKQAQEQKAFALPGPGEKN